MLRIIHYVMHAYQYNHTQVAIKILSGERLSSDNAIIKINAQTAIKILSGVWLLLDN